MLSDGEAKSQVSKIELPDFSLAGKVALVTGGSRGLGRIIALTFARAGADVAVCSRHMSGAEKVAREIRDTGRCSLAVQADTSVESDIEKMMGSVVNKLGTLDILVNNASVDLRKNLMETSGEEWDEIMAVNLRGYFLCAKAAARIMIPRKKGVIINMTSSAARKGRPATAAYCVSKAGEVMLTECLAEELIPYNIRVNGMAPGVTKTEMNRVIWEDPKRLAEYESRLFFKRFARAEEIGGLALLLASEASSYISGQTYHSANIP